MNLHHQTVTQAIEVIKKYCSASNTPIPDTTEWTVEICQTCRGFWLLSPHIVAPEDRTGSECPNCHYRNTLLRLAEAGDISQWPLLRRNHARKHIQS